MRLSLGVAAVLAALAAGGVSPAAGAGNTARYSSIVVDATTGQILHADDADALRYPASLTKTMTLYMVFDQIKAGRLKLNQKLPVSAAAASQAPSIIGLRAGDSLTVEQAILATVTKSANDAAVVLAEAVGGTEAAFANLMTRRARQLGMDHTTFRNASGLPNPRQRTTARDMATLALALLKNHREYYHYFATQEFSWNDRSFSNHNRLLNGYDGADGIKTGFIRASGFNLIASAQRHGRRVIGVVFGGDSASARDKHMAHLLDRGFARSERIEYAEAERIRLPSLIGTANAATVAETGPSRPKAEAGGSWAIQVGAFRNRKSAERQADKAAATLPDLLDDAEVSVVAGRQRGSTTYRARLLGLDESGARDACRALKARKLSCVVVPPAPAAS